jgi:hypothetical protein
MKTKHDIEQLKIIRDEYANDVGYATADDYTAYITQTKK